MKLNNVKQLLNENKSLIFTIGSVVLLGATVILEHQADKKALPKIEKKKKELGKDKLTIRETIETVGIDYIPVAATVVGSATCVIVAHKLDMKDIAAAAGAYEFLRNRNLKQKEAAKEVVGEEKAKDIESRATSNEIKERYSGKLSRKDLPEGIVQFYDPYLSQIIETTYEALNNEAKKLSNKIAREDVVYLQDYWRMLKNDGIISHYPDVIGQSFCWNRNEITDYYSRCIDHTEDDDLVYFEYMPTEVDGLPFMEINYISEPQMA